MSRKLFLMCLICALSITSAYAKCDGGTEVVGSNGSFCKSNKTMNWWSAATWCKANGRGLATMYDMCPSWDGNTGYKKCYVLTENIDGIVWSATASGKESAFYVSLSSYGDGEVNNGYKRETSHAYAICK